jgi:recombination DNA repair RAD52 pathway protein
MYLNEQQYEFLLKPIQRARIGKDGKGFAHLEAWDVRRVLIGVFGYTGWSADTTAMELIFENDRGGGRYDVAYRAQVTLKIGDTTYTEWAVGDSPNNPSRADAHDMAIKTAESQAFKRCAVNLGDAFGLSLYDGGSLRQSIRSTLDHWHGIDEHDAPVTAAAPTTDTEENPDA